MQHIVVGYGAEINSISEISGESILQFMQAHDPENVKEVLSDEFGSKKTLEELTEDEMDDFVDRLSDWVDSYNGGTAGYITDIICSETYRDLFVCIDCRFIMFESSIFPDDITEDTKKFVRNKNDVKRIISSFFPEAVLSFGYILCAGASDDASYYMEEDKDD